MSGTSNQSCSQQGEGDKDADSLSARS